MRYHVADAATRCLNGLSTGLLKGKSAVESEWNPLRNTKLGRMQSAALDTGARILRHYPKRGWDYPPVKIRNRSYPIEETVFFDKPFCKLMRFRRDKLPKNAPKVLFVAAISGHHATLSRETFQTFLPEHDVYVTDWTDARLVPMSEGRFGFEEYISYIIEFLREIGPNTHIIGLCQAGPPCMVAASVMSAQDDACRPLSMSFLGSPMDISVNPGKLTKISKRINPAILSMVALHRVPVRYPGRGRLVYPGMLQLGNFMSMSFRSHVESHMQYFKNVYHGDFGDADKIRDFYDEYFSTLDCTAEFYVETLERVFIEQQLPKGLMCYQGATVDCDTVKDIALFTIEGAKDNMVMPGQCQAALGFCNNLPDKMKQAYVQQGVGHYGVFSGTKFREIIAPKLKEFILAHNKPRARAKAV